MGIIEAYHIPIHLEFIGDSLLIHLAGRAFLRWARIGAKAVQAA
jgi:hypothetical protein